MEPLVESTMFEAVPTGTRLPSASHRLRWLARTTLVGLVGAMAVAVACVPSRLAQSGTNPQLQVTGSEFKFQVSNQSVPVGQKVTISFTNHGTIEHNFTSDAAGVHLVAQPGQTVSTT